jgi:hypothetical protein
MSEVYRKVAHDESGSDKGSRNDHDQGINAGDFVWEDVLEEISRFENFEIAMKFTNKEWDSFSVSLRNYISARRLLNRLPMETNPESKIDDPFRAMDHRPGLDSDVNKNSDVNVTVQSRSSNKVEHETVESSKQDMGSSMQRIGSNLLHVSAVCDHSYRIEAITNNLPGALVDTEPGDFEDLMEMVVLKKDFKNSNSMGGNDDMGLINPAAQKGAPRMMS